MKKRLLAVLRIVVLAIVLAVLAVLAACAPEAETPTPKATQFPPLAAPTATPAPTLVPTPIVPEGTIYFQGLLESRPWSVYKLDIETGKVELVVKEAEEPDVHGSLVVFRRWDYQKRAYDLWILTGDKEQRLTDSKPQILLHYPRWSPDGGKIVFETDCSDCAVCATEKTGIEVMSADGKNREFVLSNPNCEPHPYSFTLPTWDDKDYLVLRVFCGDPLRDRLERLDIKTGKREIIADVGVNFFDVFGNSIAYSTCGPQEGSPIFILEKGQSRRIGEEIGDWPAWSPDGKWIVFNRYDETSRFIIEPVGLGTGKTFTIPGYATRPIWVWE